MFLSQVEMCGRFARDEILDETIKGWGHGLETVNETSLVLDPDILTLLVRVRPHFSFFAEAVVIFLIILNAIDLTLALSEILNEKTRVVISEIMKNHWSELWSTSAPWIANAVRCSTILPKKWQWSLTLSMTPSIAPSMTLSMTLSLMRARRSNSFPFFQIPSYSPLCITQDLETKSYRQSERFCKKIHRTQALDTIFNVRFNRVDRPFHDCFKIGEDNEGNFDHSVMTFELDLRFWLFLRHFNSQLLIFLAEYFMRSFRNLSSSPKWFRHLRQKTTESSWFVTRLLYSWATCSCSLSGNNASASHRESVVSWFLFVGWICWLSEDIFFFPYDQRHWLKSVC